jgi:hypothetical protein
MREERLLTFPRVLRLFLLALVVRTTLFGDAARLLGYLSESFVAAW